MKMNTCLPTLGLLLGLSALTLPAQTAVSTTETEPSEAQVAGVREFTLGGGGASNKDFDSSQGSLDFSYGTFFSPNSSLTLRQTVAYVNPDNGDDDWNGATRLAYDFHFSSDSTLRPFVGFSGGRIYGENVHDSWTAGLEAGAKFFVQPRTFVYVMASYDWLFDRGSQLDERFDDGRVGWNLGIGYQF